MAAPIDDAFKRLAEIRKDFAAIPLEQQTEADTRALIIDRILSEVLGWRPGQIQRERTEGGDRLDYRLSASTEHAIVEAKKSAVNFGLPQTDVRWYGRTGPTATSDLMGKAIIQAEDYAIRWGCGLACATTGLQWVLFLCNRNDGVSRDSSHILTFKSLDDIESGSGFKLFYSVLAEPSVRTGHFRLPFLKEEGLVTEPSQGSATRLVDVRGKERQRKRSELAKTLGPLLTEVFEGLSSSQNAAALRACFVESHESDEANSRLARITKELTEDIEPLDTRQPHGSDRLAEILQQEIDDQATSPEKPSQTVLILGQHGAGKSTFIDAFFSDKLPADIRDKCLVLTVDLAKADPDPATLPLYLKERTVAVLEQVVFKGKAPTYNQLKGIFYREYHALGIGPLAPLKVKDLDAFDIEFGKRLEGFTLDRERYLRCLLENVRKSHRKLVSLIFDNADHFDDDFQRAAFLQAQWTAALGRMLLLLPMRDTTYWRARNQSALRAVRNVVLYLPRPALGKVLDKRFSFAIAELQKGESASIRSLKGIRVRVENSAELLSALQRTFTKDTNVSRTLAMLASGDIREALRLFEHCISSPHIQLDRLLAAYLAKGEYRLGADRLGSCGLSELG